jgi:6-phosphogluconolactonase (cycloisomerase 2 family)
MNVNRFSLGSPIVLLLTLASPAWPQERQTPAEREARIDRLIQQLDDDKFDVREKAEQELASIGEPALAKLIAAAKDASAERSQRAEKLLKQIRTGNTSLRYLSAVQRDDLVNANSASVSPDGKFLYIASFGCHTASVFRCDSPTGMLEHVQSLTSNDLLGVMGLRLGWNGKLAAATCGAGGRVVLFARDADKGTLRQLDVFHRDPANPLTLSAQSDAVFSPDDKFLYSLDRGGAVVVFEVTKEQRLKHVETFKGEENCFTTACGVAMHPQGTEMIVAAADAAALTVLKRDKATGKLSIHQVLRDEQDGIHGFARVYGVCYSRDLRFVYTCSDRDHAVTALKRDADGKLTVIQEFLNDQSDLKDFVRGNEILLTPDGLSLYASGSESHSIACFDVDTASGKLAYRGTVRNEGTTAPTGDGATALASSPDGSLIYVTVSSGNAVSVFQRTLPQPK